MLKHNKTENLFNCLICHTNFKLRQDCWLHVAKEHVVGKLAN